MRTPAAQRLWRLSNHPRQSASFNAALRPPPGRRRIAIQATPSTDTTTIETRTNVSSVSNPDATFEVLGSPSSLLSISLSPSQPLHTRRGTLLGLSSTPEGTADTISSLRLLSPFRRALTLTPFLFQRITSPSPLNALISAPQPWTTFCVLQLDGTRDWHIAQRRALLTWTGSTLSITPTLPMSLTAAHWGSTSVTGRGLLALVASGQCYSITLAAGETYVAHPSHVLAYSVNSDSAAKPTPFRFKSSSVSLSLPIAFGNFFPDSKFMQNMKASDTWKRLAGIAHAVRTWSRRTIWGDRLFLQFTGPTTLLIQSRGARVRDVLSRREVDEIADAPPGAVAQAVVKTIAGLDQSRTGVEGATPSAAVRKAPTLSYASVSRDGKVKIEGTESFSQSR